MYGMRGAAAAWGKCYAGNVLPQGEGCIPSSAWDDFTFCGLDEDLKWIRRHIEPWFEVKVRAVLGPEEKDDKE
eukprot:460762-Karenia_brevis.AAC.1